MTKQMLSLLPVPERSKPHRIVKQSGGPTNATSYSQDVRVQPATTAPPLRSASVVSLSKHGVEAAKESVPALRRSSRERKMVIR